MRWILPVRLVLLCGCAGAGGQAAAGAADSGAAPQVGTSAIEREVLEQVNRHRAERRLPPLLWSEDVAGVARKHSRAAAQGTATLADGNGRQRARGVSVRMPVKDWGESVTQLDVDGGLAGSLLFRVLVSSPADRARIEGSFELTGIGVARDDTGTYYLTQLFITSAPGFGRP
ncbi:MAG TPA: CAP domain-containing protein [Longimicrobiaceae bacterium]|nr:CAP domain-containing protein [Longimicrobiaceae bacterium]